MIKINIYIRNIFIILLLLTLILAFSSSYTSLSIDNLAYVIAIAIDSAETPNNIQISFQIAKTSSISSNSSSNNNENNNYIINTVESSSISNCINIMNSYIGKELNFSHCKLLIFSEDIAIAGVSKYIYTLSNNVQFRPSTNVVVSKTTAKYYLENSKPSLENLPSKYYTIFPNSSTYTGYTSNSTIGDFYHALTCDSCEPYCILGGIIDEKINTLETYSSSNPLDSGNIKSNEVSIFGERGSENIGLAVFKEDKLVGELNAIETICFTILKNEVDRISHNNRRS